MCAYEETPQPWEKKYLERIKENIAQGSLRVENNVFSHQSDWKNNSWVTG